MIYDIFHQKDQQLIELILMVQTTLKVFFAGIIILVTILFGAVVFFVYYENGFSKPTFFEWVIYLFICEVDALI